MHAIGFTWSKVFRNLVLVALAAAVLYALGEAGPFKDKLTWYVAFITGAVVLLVVLFIFNVVRAPAKLAAADTKIIAELREKLDQTEKARAAVAPLKKLFAEGQRLLQPQFQTPEAFTAWQDKVANWRHAVERELEQNMPDQHFGFSSSGFHAALIRQDVASAVHLHATQLDKLRRIIMRVDYHGQQRPTAGGASPSVPIAPRL
jgi:low affinity Fe/Cu permease